jgi:hypothetical protein
VFVKWELRDYSVMHNIRLYKSCLIRVVDYCVAHESSNNIHYRFVHAKISKHVLALRQRNQNQAGRCGARLNDHPVFAKTKVRVMPDVHLGKGTVIGFTASIDDAVIPAVVAVDIGCGVCVCNFGARRFAF